MNDPTRVQWNIDGEAALRRCNGNLKLYREKFMEVRSERAERKAEAVQKYGLSPNPEHGNWRIFQTDGGITEVEVAGSRGLTELSNVILALPRLADHQVDLSLALHVVSANFADLGQRTAGDFLNSEALRLMRNASAGPVHLPGTDPQGDLFGNMLRRVMDCYPAVAAVYHGARLSEEALQEILRPVLKPQRQAQFQQRAEVKRYDFDRR